MKLITAQKIFFYFKNVTPFVRHFAELSLDAFVSTSTNYHKDLRNKRVINNMYFANVLPFLILPAAYPRPAQLGFQEPVTPVMEGIIDFHHDLMFFLAFILGFVCFFLVNIGYSFFTRFPKNTSDKSMYQLPVNYIRVPSKKSHHLWLEIIWTIIPALILVSIVLPSFALIYSMDEFFLHPRLTLKAIGNQWYWTYNYGCALEYYPVKTDDLNADSASADESVLTEMIPSAAVLAEVPRHHFALKFDSYMQPEESIQSGQLRLLETDKRVILPTATGIRLLITSYDVLHSWAVPSFGIKLDGCPGRLNQTFSFIKREGVYYGQCSEICGVNHAFMPISIRAVAVNEFNFWLAKRIDIFKSLISETTDITFSPPSAVVEVPSDTAKLLIKITLEDIDSLISECSGVLTEEQLNYVKTHYTKEYIESEVCSIERAYAHSIKESAEVEILPYGSIYKVIEYLLTIRGEITITLGAQFLEAHIKNIENTDGPTRLAFSQLEDFKVMRNTAFYHHDHELFNELMENFFEFEPEPEEDIFAILEDVELSKEAKDAVLKFVNDPSLDDYYAGLIKAFPEHQSEFSRSDPFAPKHLTNAEFVNLLALYYSRPRS